MATVRTSRRRAPLLRPLGLAPALALAVLAAAPARAQGPSDPTAQPPEPGAAAPAARSWAVNGAIRVLSAYVDRGFVAEDGGAVVQPELEAVYTVVDRSRWSLGVLGGAFASLHSETTGVDDHGALDHAYELTGWLGLALEAGALSVQPYYEVSDSPANASGRAQELGLLVAWDDEGWHERVSLQPSLLLVRETEGAADDGENGTYLGLALRPTVALPTARLGTLRVWLPIEVGLSLADYYEDANGRDDAFGYASLGAFAAAPLAFLPGEARVELGAGHTWFGDTAREANGERGIWVGSFGLGFAF